VVEAGVQDQGVLDGEIVTEPVNGGGRVQHVLNQIGAGLDAVDSDRIQELLSTTAPFSDEIGDHGVTPEREQVTLQDRDREAPQAIIIQPVDGTLLGLIWNVTDSSP
jgi:hypothetical protein